MITTPCILAEHVNSQGRATRRDEMYRVAWEEAYGPVPDGFDLDHQCHNEDKSCAGGPTCKHRACYNLEHLELATRRDNLNRGRTFSEETNQRRSKAIARREAGRTDEERAAHAETGRENATRGWASADRSPATCECGAGPFKGPRGLTAHIKQKH